MPKIRTNSTRLGLLAVLLLLVSQSVAAAEKVYTLKLAETWPTNYPILGEANKEMAQMAETLSNGRLKIKIDSANKHKAPFGVFDLVKSGQYDMGHTASYFWKGKVPNTLYFTNMPFSMTAPEQYGWFYHGEGMDLMQQVYQPHGLLSFPGGNTGSQMGGWFQKEINSAEDLKGLKIRIPGFAGEVLAKVGAKPINIPPAELYTALERGTVDAVEWVGPALDFRMGFHKIAPYYYSGWHEPGAEMQFLINDKKWQELPDDLKEILRVSMRLAAYDAYTKNYHFSGESLATMKSEMPTLQLKRFPAEVIAVLKKANSELLQERAAADPQAKTIIESQAAYMKKARAWTNISDKAYLDSQSSAQ